jgi:predicted acyl esterase
VVTEEAVTSRSGKTRRLRQNGSTDGAGQAVQEVVSALVTSNYFLPGHRPRIEVSSSSFPRFKRNLKTGGHNYDGLEGVVAHNAVHHSSQYPSAVTIMVVKPAASANASAMK